MIDAPQRMDEINRATWREKAKVYDNVHGRRIEGGDDTSNAWWLHYVARKA